MNEMPKEKPPPTNSRIAADSAGVSAGGSLRTTICRRLPGPAGQIKPFA